VSRVIVLDSGPLGALCATRSTPTAQACERWLEELLAKGERLAIPEIVDYELRRELLRLRKRKSVARLDRLALQLEYWPPTTGAMRRAAEFWAAARQQGQPTAGDNTIDADMILAGQVADSGERDCIVATTNPTHLSRFVSAELWQNIAP